MATITVLIEGYVKSDIHVIPTTTLVKDGNNNIIVDPGMGRNKYKVLKEALNREQLSFDDINIIFTTHYHLDHTRYIGLFPKAKLIDYKYIYDGDKWMDHKGDDYHLSPNVSVIHTPGHSYEHASLKIVTARGIIVVAGDVWWFSDMTPAIDEMALDQKALEKSRKKILRIADWIIPGHGKMFRNSSREVEK